MLLQRGEVQGYDFNRMVVEFTMLNQGKIVPCAISTAAMDDLEGRRDLKAEQRVEQFMRLRELIEEKASRKFFEEQTQADRPVVLAIDRFLEIVVSTVNLVMHFEARPLGARHGFWTVSATQLVGPHGFTFGILGIGDPCIFGEPLVHHVAVRTVGPAEEYRGGEGRRFNVWAGEDCPPCLRAMDHKHSHKLHSCCDWQGACVLLLCEERIKAR
jgi:Protein of unknown function (DUF1488)